MYFIVSMLVNFSLTIRYGPERVEGPNLEVLVTNLYLSQSIMEEVQVCLRECTRPSPRKDNNDIAKIYLRNLEIFYRITRQISTKLSIKHHNLAHMWLLIETVFSGERFCPWAS